MKNWNEDALVIVIDTREYSNDWDLINKVTEAAGVEYAGGIGSLKGVQPGSSEAFAKYVKDTNHLSVFKTPSDELLKDKKECEAAYLEYINN